MEKWIENYFASTPLAMWKYRRFLMQERRFKSDYATNKAVDYAVNMLNAAIESKEDLIKAELILRDLSSAYAAMAQICSGAISESS